MKKSLLNQILKECQAGLDTHPERKNYAHFTLLFQDGKLISRGINKAHRPHKGLGYYNRELKKTGGVFHPKTHAEQNAVERARVYLNGFTAVNVRLGRDKSPRMSLPCPNCFNLLRLLRCRSVYYTTPLGFSKVLI